MILAIILNSCDTADYKTQAETWYNETKAAIFKQSDQQADSTITLYNADSSYQTVCPYAKGHLLLKRGFNHGLLRMEVYYSQDSKFELRREVCENGKVGFDGIFYEDKPYGVSTWNYCNGKTQEEGIRISDQKIGVWRKWDANGMLLDEKDYHNLGKLNQLPLISK